MEETNKSRNQQEGNNKMLSIKIGGGGGGGIGAVVLFGGALATAAFASVFVLGQKRRSSGKDRRHNSSPEINEKSEKDEDQTFHKHESGVKGETEMEKGSTVMINSAHSLKEDDEKQGDVEAREVEDDAVSVDGFVVVKEEIPLLAEKDKIQLIKEDVPEQVSIEDDGDIEAIRADKDIEGVQIDKINDDKNVSMELKMEEREFGGFCNGNGEIKEEKVVKPDAIDRAKVDFNGDGIVVSDSHNADGYQPLLLTAAVEMDESIVGCIAEMTVNGCIVNQSKKQNGENGEVGESLEVDVKMNVEKEVLKGLESVEYGENEEAPDLGLNENEAAALVQHPDSHGTEGHKDNKEREIEKEERLVDSQTEGHKDNVERETGKEERLVGRGESNWEALWQSEWPKASPEQVKIMSYEVGGKIQEDMKGNFLEKYEVEMETVKDHTRNSTRRGMMIWMVCVVSSLSCSWFLDLSCAKICLVVFLTVFLLEIYGYPLVNRKGDQCLHAVKGEGSYQQRS